jgi:branched-chain amino acid transport system ATP-binding protein
MNEGKVLVDGTVEDARNSPKVQEVYIGSGARASPPSPRESAAEPRRCSRRAVDTFYGKSHILNDVSFDVHEHEIIALLGRNGAGKSTLLKTLIGIAPPADRLDQARRRRDRGLSSAQIARLGIGYVPQGRGLFAGMSVARTSSSAPEAPDRQRRALGRRAHLRIFPAHSRALDTPADYLSGGEQQMVAVARALSGDVRVLLLDEPFEGLAPAVVEQLFETFDRLRRRSRSSSSITPRSGAGACPTARWRWSAAGDPPGPVEGPCATISICAARCCGCEERLCQARTPSRHRRRRPDRTRLGRDLCPRRLESCGSPIRIFPR